MLEIIKIIFLFIPVFLITVIPACWWGGFIANLAIKYWY
jgi:hypothetical protein